MEVEETTEQTAEEVSIPAESEQEQVPEEQVPPPDADDENESKPDASDAKSGFSSIFDKARQAALAAQSNSEEAEKEAEINPESDEKIPEEETKPDETEAETEGEPKDEEPKEPKKTTRSESFKQMEAERDAANAKVTEVETRLTKLDEQFEKYGGVETVETAMELFELAADKTKATGFVEKINSLPHKAAIQREVFENVLDLPANRVYGINRVLRTDFGLEQNLNQPILEKLFEFATTRLNADPTEFENFLERELELSGKEENETERLRAEIARLKESPKEQKEESPQESEQEFASRIQKTYNEFEDKTFEQVSAPELGKYGFSINQNDTAEVKKAKTYLANAVKFAVAVEMREAKAHESLLDFWIEKSPETNKFYGQAQKAYQNAMTIKVQNALKAIAPLLGAKKVEQPKEEIPGKTITETAASKKEQTKIPLPKKEQPKPKGFGEAFNLARKKAYQP